MTRGCVIVTGADASRPGSSDWRRAAMLAEFYAEMGFETIGASTFPTASASGAANLRGIVDQPAFVALDSLAESADFLRRRFGASVLHIAGGVDAPVDFAGYTVVLRDHLSPSDAPLAGENEISVLFEKHDDQEGGDNSVLAALLRRSRPLMKRSAAEGDLIAGCWVENEGRSIAAVQSLLDQIARRGGAFGPSISIAGPGRAAISPPRIPRPVTVMEDWVSEQVFYRGLDIALFPDEVEGGARSPRYDVVGALELGATPLACDSALVGVRDFWRLPSFGSIGDLALYLYENGRALSRGGVIAELRARADWTRSGASNAIERQRATLADAISRRIA